MIIPITRKTISILFLLLIFFCFSSNAIVHAQNNQANDTFPNIIPVQNDTDLVGRSGDTGTIYTDIGNEIYKYGIFRDNIGTYIYIAVVSLLIFGAVACLLFILWGGIEYITSGGEQQKYESARNKITYAVVGLAILAVAFLLWQIMLYITGLDQLELLKTPEWQAGRPESAVTTQSGGTTSTNSDGYDCSPFSSCEAWQQQYVQKHPGAKPPPIGTGLAWEEFVWSRDTIYYQQNRSATPED